MANISRQKYILVKQITVKNIGCQGAKERAGGRSNFHSMSSAACENAGKVVSIGRLTDFYVVFVPLEYIPNEPPN